MPKQIYWNGLRMLRARASRLRQYSFVMALALVLSVGFVGTAAGTTSSSTHYMVNETQFGGVGSSLHDCSTSYCAQTSVGDTVAGSANSTSYGATFGADTSDVPLLEEIVTGGNQNMGVLDDTHTGTATATISVRSYLSNGYVLQITGAPPNQGIHTLNRLATPSTSQPGTEQFGINLADNTTPNIGADPVQVPDSSTSFGQVISDTDTVNGVNPNTDGAYFNVPDFFVYNDSDIVARSLKNSGETDYTMSIIINVSKVTPGGQYTGVYSAVVVPVY